MMELCTVQSCTGCFACKNICPKQAIFVGKDSLGKTIPKIDDTLCIECGLCRKVCPVLQPVSLQYPYDAYAVWSKNKDDLQYSSSGGAGAVFARCVLSSGGVVCGAAVKDGTAKHILINSEEQIDQLRGSKYVQSEMGDCYKQIKQYLLAGKQVLFIGTPCQSAGLQRYLQKDYENLLTVDLICHGTPPQVYLSEHLAKHTKKYTSFSFRGKYDWFLTAYDSSRISYQREREKDIYFLSFLDALTYRDNCYSCRYARLERVSDITIGDFWGLDRSTMKHPYNGRVSLVLPNTEKGSQFFNQIKEQFVYEKRTIQEAANKEQGNLLHPSIPHKDRQKFEEVYRKKGFEAAVSATSIKKEIQINIVKSSKCYRLIAKIKRVVCRCLHLL